MKYNIKIDKERMDTKNAMRKILMKGKKSLDTECWENQMKQNIKIRREWEKKKHSSTYFFIALIILVHIKEN